ncbi:MAG: carbohydrate kinase, partial [Nitrospiraceae bacterium]|nr:carbohydrate kinase [Nitrospiraceae bacterium]
LPDGKQLGGAPANFAYHAQVLGAKGVVVSAVGADELGQQIRDQLDARGLDSSHVGISYDRPTGTVSVEIDERGKPNYTIHENVAWDAIPWTEAVQKLAAEADAVCFGSLCQRAPVARQTIREFLAETRPGCLRVFDINLRQSFYDRDIVETSLGLASILKLNDEELPVVAKLLDCEDSQPKLLHRLMEQYELNAIALTMGADGCLLATHEASVQHPGFAPEEIADTIGAGDSFAAAMVMGMLRDDPLEDICAQANRLASWVCAQAGAMPQAVPPRSGLQHR